MPPVERLRFGIHIFRSRYRSKWRWLDQIPAKPWLIENIGERAYNVIWHPLLNVKFGRYHDQISAAWVWHRIWRVATSRKTPFGRESFGYLDEGSATLVDSVVAWLRQQPNVTLRAGARVSPLEVRDNRITEIRVDGEMIACDAVISTVALPTLSRLVPGDLGDYFVKVRRIEYIGVVCMLLSLKQSLSRNFWTNINDRRISFNGIIEQTNLNRNLQAAGLNIVYVPFYLPTTEARYTATDDALFADVHRDAQVDQPVLF